jgi:hypothetical protein
VRRWPGGAGTALLAVILAACGARTGLFIEVQLDGGGAGELDAAPSDSGQADVAVDSPVDAAVTFDAPPDVTADAAVDAPPADAGNVCDGPCPCPPGTMTVGSSCLPIVGSISAPRPVSPLSTARVSSATPILTWALPAGDDGAVVERCADRACTQITQAFLAPGTSGSPAAPLPAGVSFWRLLGTSSGSVGSSPGPTWEFFAPVAAAPSVRTWWGSTLDVNGDGLADVGIGAPDGDGRLGLAYLFVSQRGAGPVGVPIQLDGGGAFGDQQGCTIGSAGDVNGDGFGDLVVGQCDIDMAGQSAAYVYLGGPSGIAATPTVLSPPVSTVAYGYAAGTAGDANGDGYADLVVGSTTGIGYLYLGGPTGIGTPPTPLQCALGSASASAIANADVNGDGWSDLILGGYEANGMDGTACVYLGTPAGLSTTPMPLPGPPAGSHAGFGLEIAVGDLNADGYADALISAWLFGGQSGEGLLFMGGPGGLDSPPIVLANPDGANAGRFTDGLGGVHDVNGDGFDDLVVGSYLAGGNLGAAWLYLGGPSGLSMPIPLANPVSPGGYFGTAAGGGDVDGDGFADVVVGAEGVDGYAGAAYLYRGSAAGLLAPTPLGNPSTGLAAFGYWVGM